jgi:hypothetical protein
LQYTRVTLAVTRVTLAMTLAVQMAFHIGELIAIGIERIIERLNNLQSIFVPEYFFIKAN